MMSLQTESNLNNRGLWAEHCVPVRNVIAAGAAA